MKRVTAYVLGLGVALVAVQLRAQVVQVEGGYRPFGQAAKRVAFSWDMFAVGIERCSLTWDPPLSIEGKKVSRWSDRGTYLEWDPAYADVEGYEQKAAYACDYRTSDETIVRMSCRSSGGASSETWFRCP